MYVCTYVCVCVMGVASPFWLTVHVCMHELHTHFNFTYMMSFYSLSCTCVVWCAYACICTWMSTQYTEWSVWPWIQATQTHTHTQKRLPKYAHQSLYITRKEQYAFKLALKWVPVCIQNLSASCKRTCVGKTRKMFLIRKNRHLAPYRGSEMSYENIHTWCIMA